MPKIIDKEAIHYWRKVLGRAGNTAFQEVAMKLAIIGLVIALLLITLAFAAFRLGVVSDSFFASLVDFAQASWGAFCVALVLMTSLFLAVLYRTPADMDKETREEMDSCKQE